MTKIRDLARILGRTEAENTGNNRLLFEGETGGVDSAQTETIASGAPMKVYTGLDSLPTSGLSAGDQAYVESNNRLYISNGAGWYNIALANSTPYWDSEPLTSYDITDSVTPLIIVAKAKDSDNSDNNLFHQSTVSDSAAFLVDITRDSSVYTFTPKSADSIGASVTAGDLTDSNTNDFIYTFKWSDGINFVSKAVTINYNFSTGFHRVTQANYGATWNALSFTTIYGGGTISNNSGQYSWSIGSITSSFYTAAAALKKDGDHANGAWWKIRASGMPTSFAERSSINLLWQDGIDTGYEYRMYVASYNPDYTTDPHRWSHGFSDGSGLNTGTLTGWDQAFFYNPSDGVFRMLLSTNSGSTWSEMTGFSKTIPASSRAASDYFIINLAGRTGSGQTMQLLDAEDLSGSVADWPY